MVDRVEVFAKVKVNGPRDVAVKDHGHISFYDGVARVAPHVARAIVDQGDGICPDLELVEAAAKNPAPAAVTGPGSDANHTDNPE